MRVVTVSVCVTTSFPCQSYCWLHRNTDIDILTAADYISERVPNRLGVLMLMEPDKEVGPATTLTFLGIELDSGAMVARLPPDKLEDLMVNILRWLSRRKSTKRNLRSIIGKLSFACKVVPAGRIFLRRLIDLAATVHRGHHHVSITSEFRKD